MRLVVGIRNVFAIDVRTLALFRIALGCVLLVDLLWRANDLTSMYTDEGLMPTADWWTLRENELSWSLHAMLGSTQFVVGLFLLHGLLAIGIVFGVRARWCCLFSWLLLVSLHHRNPLLVTGGDILLSMLLFWGSMLPVDARWSVSTSELRSRTTRHFSMASIGIILQIFAIYLITGWSKVSEAWLSGEAIERVLHYEMLVRPCGVWLRQYPIATTSLTFFTLALELIGPWLLLSTIWKYRLRAAALAAFVTLHVGIELTMNVVIYSWVSMAALLVFLPGFVWESRRLPDFFRRMRRVNNDANVLAATRWYSRLQHAFTNIVCVFAIAFIVVYNATYVIGGWQTTPLLDKVASIITWNQQWTMFANPRRRDYRHVMLAQLANGKTVDVLRDGASIDVNDPSTYPSRLAPRDWQLLTMYLNFEANARYRQRASQYRFDTWNASRNDDEQIELLVYAKIDAAATESNEAARAIENPLAKVDAFKYVDGQPHGQWVHRYPNGNVNARGSYSNGVMQGQWQFFYADGSIESEGLFYNNQQHGLWKMWNKDGVESTKRFTYGEEISLDATSLKPPSQRD